MVRRVVVLVVVVGLLGVLASSGGPLVAVIPWVLMAYLVWRAWPGIRGDLGGLGRLRVPGMVGLRRGRGERL